jgi:5S rRNA maturation endonuclease (ribonuclease M5)
MTAYLVVEGERDSQLLSRVLSDEIRSRIEVVVAGGKSSIRSTARTLAASRRQPVIALLDADTTYPQLIDEQQSTIESVIKSASITNLVTVILAIPTIESLFFEDSSWLARVLDTPISDAHAVLGRFQPHEALKQITGSDDAVNAILNRATPSHLEQLRTTTLVRQIVEAVVTYQILAQAA